MKFNSILVLGVIITVFSSCNQDPKTSQNEDELVFPKGERISNSNFTGNAWVSMLVEADSLNQTYAGNVTFEPEARTNWHSHPSGQIILVIDGEGYYQEKGSSKRILRKGDAVKCPPNLPHWHGAGPDREFIQLAISSSENGPAVWLEPVTDEEYNN